MITLCISFLVTVYKREIATKVFVSFERDSKTIIIKSLIIHKENTENLLYIYCTVQRLTSCTKSVDWHFVITVIKGLKERRIKLRLIYIYVCTQS